MSTRVDTSIFSAVLVEDPPKPIRDAVVNSIFSNNGLVPNIIGASFSRIGSKAKQLMAATLSYYPEGIVESRLNQANINKLKVLVVEAISTEYNIPINLISILGSLEYGVNVNLEYVVKHYLKNTYGWNSTTNTIGYDSYTVHEETIVILSATGVIDIIPLPLWSDEYYWCQWVSGSHTNYWAYNSFTGTNIDLNEVADIAYGINFLPVIPLRESKISVTEDKTKDIYKRTKKILNVLKIDVNELVSSIEESPDIDMINGAFLMFGVHVYTKTQVGMKYLDRFFSSFANITEGYSYGSAQVNAVEIKCSTFMVQIRFNDIWITHWDGVISTPTGALGVGNRDIEITEGSIRIRQQLANATYRQVLVINPTATNTVIVERTSPLFGNYLTNSINYHTAVKLNPDPNIKLKQDAFLIPLSFDILDSFTLEERDALLYESMRLYIHAVQYTDLAWYESDEFITLVQVVGTVLSVFTAGQSLLAAAAISTAALATTVVVMVLIKVAVDYAIQWLYENTDLVLATIFAVALSMYTSGYNFSIQGLVRSTAEFLFKAVTVTSEVLSKLNQLEYKDLMKEAEEFQNEYDKKQEELDAAYDSLNQPMMNIAERPESFYNRTVHTMNPGVASLDMIAQYVNKALELPKLER